MKIKHFLKATLLSVTMFIATTTSHSSFDMEKAVSAAMSAQQLKSQPKPQAKIQYASYYGKGFHGRKTANGEIFNMYELTAAHRTLKFNTKVKVTCVTTGKSVIVRINDRGPYHGNRSIDLSKGAAAKIGMLNTGVGRVIIQIL